MKYDAGCTSSFRHFALIQVRESTTVQNGEELRGIDKNFVALCEKST